MRNFSIKEQTVSRPELGDLQLVFSSDPHNSAIMRLTMSEAGGGVCAMTFNANGYLDTVRVLEAGEAPWNNGPKSGYDANGKLLDPHAGAEEAAQEETRRLQAEAEQESAQSLDKAVSGQAGAGSLNQGGPGLNPTA